MKVVLFLLIASCLCTCNGIYTNVVKGIHSKTTSSDEIKLPSTSSYLPINALISMIYIFKPSSVFVYYQLNLNKTTTVYTKLEVNDLNVGSIVRKGPQDYKSIAGYWMGYLKLGYYTFKVLYTGSIVYVPSNVEWQTAKMDIIWFEQTTTDVLTDNIKCYPVPMTSNNYNNWGPVNNLAVTVQLPANGPVLTAYQFSTSSSHQVFSSLDLNGFNYPLLLLLHTQLVYLSWTCMAFWPKSWMMEYTTLMFFIDHL